MILLGIQLLAIAAFWHFAIQEESSIRVDSEARLDDEQLALDRMEMEIGTTSAIFQRYRSNLDEISYFRTNFLQNRESRIVRISAFLAETAEETGVQLNTVRYASGRTKDRDLEIYSMALPIKGRYRDIRAFIDAVERSDMYLTVGEMSFTEQDRSGALVMELVLSTYFEGGGA
jgi:Tfp pilus assembly protein PilO